MTSTYPYVRLEPNYNSAYNILPVAVPPPTICLPLYASTTFLPISTRSSSPFFRRTCSPPPRPPVLMDTRPKFNFDLYNMDNKYDEYPCRISPRCRSASPPSTRVVYHYPVRLPRASPTCETESFAKLRQANDELCRALARSELIDQRSVRPLQHHIHHYPLPQHSYEKHRCRSRGDERPSVTEFDVVIPID